METTEESLSRVSEANAVLSITSVFPSLYVTSYSPVSVMERAFAVSATVRPASGTMSWADVVGTLSGDDTFLVIMHTEQAAGKICEELNRYVMLH